MKLLALLLGLATPLPSADAPDARLQVLALVQATQAGRHDDAREVLRALLDSNPQAVRGSYLVYPQVTLAAEADRCAEAEAALARLDGSAWQPSAWQAAGNCWWRAQERERALGLLDRPPSVPSDKERCVALWFRARLLEPAGRVKEAAEAYREIWVTCPISNMGDQAYQALQRLAASGRVRLKGKRVDDYLLEAEKWRRTGRYGRAQSTLKQALARAQQDRDAAAEATVRLGLVELFITLGYYRSALGQTQTLISSRRFDAGQQAAARRLTADIYSRRRRVDEAFEQLQLCAAQSTAGDEVARCRLDWAELHIKLAQLASARTVLAPFFQPEAGLPERGPIAARARWLDTWLAWRAGGIAAASQPIARLIEAEDQGGRELYWLGRWHLLAGDARSARRYWYLASQRDLLEYYAVVARGAALRLELSRGGPTPLACTASDPAELAASLAGSLAASLSAGLVPGAALGLAGLASDVDWPRCREPLDEIVDQAQAADVEGRWFRTAHPDITAAQDLTDLGLIGEAMRWLKPVGSLDRTPTERLALAQVYLRQDQPFWSNIIARHAVLPFLRRQETSRLDERASAEACAALRGPCEEPVAAETFPAQADLSLRIAFPTPYEEHVVTAAKRNDLPIALVYAVIYEESAFNPEARSGRQARGLMQLIGRTAHRMARLEGLRGFGLYKLYQPETNIQLGSRYLAELWRRYDGVPALVFAAYHAGEKAVDRWVRERGGLPLDAFVEEIPYASTRGYVKKCIATTASYARLGFADDRLELDFAAPLPLTLRQRLAQKLPGELLPGERARASGKPAGARTSSAPPQAGVQPASQPAGEERPLAAAGAEATRVGEEAAETTVGVEVAEEAPLGDEPLPEQPQLEAPEAEEAVPADLPTEALPDEGLSAEEPVAP